MNIQSTDLIQQNQEWIKALAYNLSETQGYVDFDDLVQVGTIRLLKCAEKYDETQGATLKTFCTVPVRGAMLNEIQRFTPGARQQGDYSLVNIEEISDELLDTETPELVSLIESDTALRECILNELPAILSDREASVLQMFLSGMDSVDIATHFKFTPRRSTQIMAGIQAKVSVFATRYYNLKAG